MCRIVFCIAISLSCQVCSNLALQLHSDVPGSGNVMLRCSWRTALAYKQICGAHSDGCYAVGRALCIRQASSQWQANYDSPHIGPLNETGKHGCVPSVTVRTTMSKSYLKLDWSVDVSKYRGGLFSMHRLCVDSIMVR